MHAEELKHKPIGPVAGVFITLGIVAAVMAAVLVVGALQVWLGVYWLQFLLYAAAIAAVALIVKHMLTEYIYLIEKGRITFGRRIGKREKELLSVPFHDIRSFGPLEEMARRVQGKKRYKFTFRKKPDWYVIDCEGFVVILSPTPEYIEKLGQAAGEKKV